MNAKINKVTEREQPTTVAGQEIVSEKAYHESTCAVQPYIKIDGPCDCGFTDLVVAAENEAEMRGYRSGYKAGWRMMKERS